MPPVGMVQFLAGRQNHLVLSFTNANYFLWMYSQGGIPTWMCVNVSEITDHGHLVFGGHLLHREQSRSLLISKCQNGAPWRAEFKREKV